MKKWVGLVIALMAMISAVGAESGVKRELPPYSKLHRDVPVGLGALADNYSERSTRPAGIFQLSGSADDELCNEVLTALNLPGTYKGSDDLYWWVAGPAEISWQVVVPAPHPRRPFDPAPEHYGTRMIQGATVDLNADGRLEYVYRKSTHISDVPMHSIGIFDRDILADRSLINGYLKMECDAIGGPPDNPACESLKTGKITADEVIYQLIETRFSVEGKGAWRSGINNRSRGKVWNDLIDMNLVEKLPIERMATLIHSKAGYGLLQYPVMRRRTEPLELAYYRLHPNKELELVCLITAKEWLAAQ